MDKFLGNIVMWGLLFSLIAGGGINVPRATGIIAEKLGRVFVVLVTPEGGNDAQ